MNDLLSTAADDQQVTKAKNIASGPCSVRRRPILMFMGSLVFVSVVIGYAAIQSGSISRALAYLAGQRVFVEHRIDLGVVRCGGEMLAEIEVFNSDSNPVSIVGARKSCGCIEIETFPIEVFAHAGQRLRITLRVPEDPVEFKHLIELYIAGSSGQSFRPFAVAVSGVAKKS